MKYTFVVGQKVVCVNATPIGLPWVPLIKGAVYTVSGFFLGHPKVPPGEVCITLAEQANGGVAYSVPDGGYLASRFRPLVATKTDISLFQKILEKASKEVKESAQ